jgi:predicted PurR-regulated permease PerM
MSDADIRHTVAALLLGMLLGAVLMFLWQGREIDRLSREVSHYIMEKEDLLRQIDQLTQRLQQPEQEPTVQVIRVDAMAPDDMSQIQAVQFVKQTLQWLVGRPLQVLTRWPEIPAQLVEGRSFSVNDEEYVVHVNTVVIGPTLYVKVTVQEANRS